MDDRLPEPDEKLEAAWLLFSEEKGPDRPKEKPTRPTPAPAPAPLARPESVDPGDGYAIEGTESGFEVPVAPPIPSAERARPRAEDRPSQGSKRDRPARQPSSGVGEVWSRGAEWGTSLVVFGAGAAAAVVLLYATFSVNNLFLWAMLFLASVAGLGVLAYPMFITLERPVRVTPEQAVKDYFGALSHLVPHYKRMWLLLAIDGRVSYSFRTFDEFRAYWKGKLAAWKQAAGTSGTFNKFDVEVEDFKSDKSAGQSEIEASYTARVVRRDQPGTAPVASYRVSLRLVRGEDKMWYLEGGTLD